MASNCDECGKDLTTVANRKIAIHCDAGNHWFCYSCIDMSKRLFESIKAEKETPMLLVSCKVCTSSSFPMAALKNSSATEFKRITEKIEALSLKMDTYKDIEGKVSESMELFKKQTEVNTVNYADIVRTNIEAKKEIMNVKEAVETSVKDHFEHDDRDRSIIIFKHDESTQETKADKNEDDLTFVKDFIKDGIKISSQDIQSCFRLGIYKDNVCRPLKVTFAHKSGQVKVMDYLSRLMNAEERFKAVSVSIDRSEPQREEIRRLLLDADQRTKASNGTKKFYVRGSYKPYIVEKAVPQ